MIDFVKQDHEWIRRMVITGSLASSGIARHCVFGTFLAITVRARSDATASQEQTFL